jgi:alpha-ribazole phosphatase
LTRLLLVRHGETGWNRAGRYQGQSDTELSKIGIEQAKKLRERLAAEGIDAIYSSDLKRALRTAELIASVHDVEVVPRQELRELDFGEFEGRYFEEIKERYLPLDQMWRGEDLEARAPGGESLYQLANRVSQFENKLGRVPDKETILIVAHGGSLRVLICLLLGVGLECWWQFQLDSASLSIVEIYPERNILSVLNDTCHLRDLKE